MLFMHKIEHMVRLTTAMIICLEIILADGKESGM